MPAFSTRNNPDLLWLIMGFLIVIAACVTAYFWMTEDANKNIAASQAASAVTQTSVKPAVTQAVQPQLASSVVKATPAPSTAVQEKSHHSTALVTDNLLKDPVPATSSLAKEEVAKLNDLQSQLNDQEKTLKAQHADADTLIKLKEEQIKLLEKQLNKS